MLDIRPIGYVIGLLVMAMGVAMLPPMVIDIAEARDEWHVFLISAILSISVGSVMAIASSNGVKQGLTIQQTFLLTTGVWVALPIFGAIPFIFGATEATVTDAYFEAMSGMTTTGSTVFTGLDDLPKGLLLWRGILQWLGGIGIIVVAMVFLPELRVGGMQVFKAESFDTFGKILPRAATIASQISVIYVGITMACGVAYALVGMNAFDATVHAMTTVATGGFANYDASFGNFSGTAEYVASVFMIIAALPFVRYVQLINGNPLALVQDTQVKAFLIVVLFLTVLCSVVLLTIFPHHWEQAFREALFNITSIISGTGYASVDYMNWGSFLIAIFFFIGLIGGCAGSTACSVKIFRYQILFASIWAQLQRIHSPRGIFVPKFNGRPITEDALSSVITFFMMFILTIAVLAVLLGLTGLDFITSVSGAATAVANIGPGLGHQIGPSGNFAGLNDTAKWLLIIGMLVGRLELLSVYALLSLKFWRA